MKRLLPLTLLLTAVGFGYVHAQDCAQTLRLARATYEQGRLREIEGQLKTCLEGGFKKTEKQLKVEAYKLLTLSYIYLEEPEKADQAMLNLKLTDPYYIPNPAVDPAEFVALYNSFRKDPVYRIGAKLGVNSSRPNVTDLNTAVELTEDSEYKPLFAIQFGAAIDLPLNDRLTLHGEVLYEQHRFEIDQKVNRGTDPDTQEPLINSFEGIETQNWISVPISAEYNFLNLKSAVHERLRPFVSLGVEGGYLLPSPVITALRNRAGESSIPESGIDVDREKIRISALVGAGVKTKIASGLLVFEIRYVHGLTDVSSEDTAYTNQRLVWEYGYADPVFKMSSLAITASYVQDIFKPKKLRSKK